MALDSPKLHIKRIPDGQESFSREGVKDLAREVAEHHAQRLTLHRAQHHETSRVTRSFARNIKPQHHALKKLTGEIVKPDAKLAHQISQKLRLSRGIGVFTIS